VTVVSQYLGVDLGATHVRAAVGSDPDRILGRATDETPQTGDGSAVSERLVEVARAACADAGTDPGEIVIAGVGTFGPIDRAAGTIVNPANVAGEVGRIQVVRPLRERLGIDRVVFRNDTTAGVIGERYGAASPAKNLVYLTISTGIGAGVAIDDRIIDGRDGNAGEVGHTTVDHAGEMACRCGSDGHWEAYCSGRNIPRYATHLHRTTEWSTTLPVGEPAFTARDVFEAAPEDEFAAHVIDRLGHWNAIGVANTIQAFAPSELVIGGAVAVNNPDAILDPIRRQVPDRTTLEVPEIRLTDLGGDVVLYGALASALLADG
jgi:glucokinase